MGSFDGELLDQVERAVTEHIADTQKLPSTPEVVARVDRGDSTVRSALEALVAQKRLTTAYEAPKNPTIYVPTYMYEGMLAREKRPDWIDRYVLKEATDIQRRIRTQQQQLEKFRHLERLLYHTGRSLEKAVGSALEQFEFEEYAADYNDADRWDYQFQHEGFTYVCDAKGKSRWADKPDVGQLQQWIMHYVGQHEEADPERVIGVLIINHFREVDPAERGPDNPERPPLSSAAVRYLKLGPMRYLTTDDLFEVAKELETGRIKPETARRRLIQKLRQEVGGEKAA